MKKLRITIACLLLTAGLTFAQATASISITDNSGSPTSGTYTSSQVFTLDANLSWSGFTPAGFSLWLEVPTALAPFISITNEQHFVFPDATDNGYPKAFTASSGADSGFLANTDTVINPQSGTIDAGDLGATGAIQGSSGTGVKVATIEFTLAGAPNGTYTLQTTSISPRRSVMNEPGGTGGATHGLPTATYTITIVPEPATWSLMGLGGFGAVGLTWLRARRKS